MKVLLLCVVLTIQATQAFADPRVLYDAGSSVYAKKYIEMQDSPDIPPAKPNLSGFISPNTPEMSVGRVATREIDLPYLHNPLFLIGTDDISLWWLSRHREALIASGAIGLIVNASSPNELQRAISLATGLQVAPASASELSKQLGLTHYPVLITSTQIAQ